MSSADVALPGGKINEAILELFERCLDVRGTGWTDMFANLWRELHEQLEAPPSMRSLPKDVARFVSYIQLGVKDSINPFDTELENLFLTHYDKDDNLCPRDNKEAEWIEKELGYPAVLTAEAAAQCIARSRVMLGIYESIMKNGEGELVDCVFETKHNTGEVFQCAFAISDKPGYFKSIIDRSKKHIHIISGFELSPYAPYAVRALISDPDSPEFGFTYTHHVVIINKNFPYTLLDEPADLIYLIEKPPFQLWFIGKDQAFNEKANIAALDPVHVSKSVFHHALTFFSAKSAPENWRYLEAWFKLVYRINNYLKESTDNYQGLPPRLLSAMQDADARWKDGLPSHKRRTIARTLMDWREAEEDSEDNTGEQKRDLGWRPVKHNLNLLPDGIREQERARWDRFSLEHKTPEPVEPEGEPCPKCGKSGPHRCRF